MSDRGPAIFSDPDIMRIAELLKVKHRWQVRYLANVLRSLPQTIALFRSMRSATPPSRTEIFLRQIAAEPTRLNRLFEAKTSSARAASFDRMLKLHDGLALLQYQVAALLPPVGRAEPRLSDGSARRALIALSLDVPLIRRAAANAIRSLGRQIQRGKGGNRRSAKSVAQLVVVYLLETYVDICGRQPHVTNNMTKGTIEGPAVEFLREVLSKVAIRLPSGTTLRRWIDDFRLGPRKGSDLAVRLIWASVRSRKV